MSTGSNDGSIAANAAAAAVISNARLAAAPTGTPSNSELQERAFLLQLVLNKFNEQFKLNLDIDKYTIESDTTNVKLDRCYLIQTSITTDNARIRIHMSLTNRDVLNSFKLELGNSITSTGSLADEVYVAYGELNKDHITNKKFVFGKLGSYTLPINTDYPEVTFSSN